MVDVPPNKKDREKPAEVRSPLLDADVPEYVKEAGERPINAGDQACYMLVERRESGAFVSANVLNT